MIKIGFTGTRRGMTEDQARSTFWALEHIVRNKGLKEVQLTHGGCIGADAQAHAIAMGLGIFCNIYPGPHPKMTMDLPQQQYGCMVYPRMGYKARNKIIANSEILIAAPFEDEEQQRGGTWQTFRFGLANRAKIRLIHRDGAIEHVPF